MNSEETPYFFIRDEPDWSSPFGLRVGFLTAIVKFTSGGEQTTALSGRPKISMNYTFTGEDRAAWSARRALNESMQQGPVVCPIWALPQVTTDVRTLPFRADLVLVFKGSYVYHLEADSFHKVTNISGNFLTLEDAYTANTGATFIPCITGELKVDFMHQSLDSTETTITIKSF